VSGFPDDGWSCLLNTDGAEDITVTINSSPNKLVGSHVSASPFFSAMGGGIMCAKASMLLQVCTCAPFCVMFVRLLVHFSCLLAVTILNKQSSW
jgi:hypothetical protein